MLSSCTSNLVFSILRETSWNFNWMGWIYERTICLPCVQLIYVSLSSTIDDPLYSVEDSRTRFIRVGSQVCLLKLYKFYVTIGVHSFHVYLNNIWPSRQIWLDRTLSSSKRFSFFEIASFKLSAYVLVLFRSIEIQKTKCT